MVQIRLVREEDAEALAAIYAPFVEQTAISFETVPPGRDEMLRRIVETTAIYPWLVCALEGKVVGYAYATQHRVRAAYRWSVDTSAYVGAAHHRRGIGRGLYASLFAVLHAQGFFNAYAGITLPNAASVGLHEAVGFKNLGIYKKTGYKLGTWHDVGWWQLALQAHAGSPAEPLALSTVMASPNWEHVVRRGEGLIRGKTA
ncbi:MAG TPA: arsinothricin resistance N-acetyltransferase ArsN1 family B [Parapedobacter sp.]|nr:arsinothricin resistance N-acetyltransferase ArsN1 family B [Parapedobacter sp.]